MDQSRVSLYMTAVASHSQLGQTTRDDPYEVQLTIPVEGYDPIQFSLTKMCDNVQFFVISTLFFCGGFIYKIQHGIDALPDMTILSACLETVSGGGGYMRADDLNGEYASQASWTREPVSGAGSSRTNERRYWT
ncbi:hypothetical protein Hanom_Chr09g00831151 [Helianthus anomalus]